MGFELILKLNNISVSNYKTVIRIVDESPTLNWEFDLVNRVTVSSSGIVSASGEYNQDNYEVRISTVVDGIGKESDPSKITKILKSKLACGGTLKQGKIELQGDHRAKVKKILIQNGFAEEKIEVE